MVLLKEIPMFANTDKEITIIYSSQNPVAKQILAYSKTEGLPIHSIDITKMPLNATQWSGIALKMNMPISELINTQSAAFIRLSETFISLSDNDWLKLLTHNPEILKAPIVMKGDKVVIMQNPQDMLRFLE